MTKGEQHGNAGISSKKVVVSFFSWTLCSPAFARGWRECTGIGGGWQRTGCCLLCSLCHCGPDVFLQTLQSLLDEETALLTHSISSVGVAWSSENAQRLLRSGESRDDNNSPVARASPSSSSSSISKSSSFWKRIRTTSPAGSNVKEEADTLETSPPWRS